MFLLRMAQEMNKPPVYNSQYQAYVARQKQKDKLRQIAEPRSGKTVFVFKDNPLAKEFLVEAENGENERTNQS